MKKEYTVILNNSILEEEDHERNEENLVKINIIDKDGNVLDNKNIYAVQIKFSQDGALGFGKELIRAAFNRPFDKEYHNHLVPTRFGKATLNMGICITHDSPELIIGFQNLGNIREDIKKSQKID